MLKTLSKTIYTRKSCRSYEKTAIDSEAISKIRDFLGSAKPLYPEIKISFEILDKNKVNCLLPWKTENAVAVYTEKTDDAYVNAGFIIQQLDLYLQSVGYGACWLGMGKPKGEVKTKDGLDFAIMLAFGTPKGDAVRRDASEFNRKSLLEISDTPDCRLEAVRLAPSACNSQPWYFIHDRNVLHIYRKHSPMLSEMNKIDMGIALSHLYVENPGSFKFFKTDVPERAGYSYTGTVEI